MNIKVIRNSGSVSVHHPLIIYIDVKANSSPNLMLTFSKNLLLTIPLELTKENSLTSGFEPGFS